MRNLSILLLLVLGPSSALAETPKKQPPNFLIIVTDDQRFDLMSCAGHPILKTPNIDRIAKSGIRFRNSFVTTPICAASRASILTGLYERTHKYTFSTPPITAEHCAVSYPFRLRQAGYRTALVGKFGVNVANGQTAAMFDELHKFAAPFQRPLPNGEVRHIDQIATDVALRFLRDGDKSKPFCLSVSFNSPHADDGKINDLYPWPKTVDGLYDKVRIPDPPLLDAKHYDGLPAFLRDGLGKKRWFWQFDTPEKYQKNVRAYFRMISGIDHEIGRLLDELDALGLSGDTIVVFMSDNGYFLGERGLSGKWVHFEESLRVPLIIADPRAPSGKGTTNDQIVLNIDLAPTVLDLAGLQSEKMHQGRSLAPLIRGQKAESWRDDFFCEHLMANPDIAKWEGVRGSRYVYARYFEQTPPYEFLHDLKTDPNEVRNLADDPASMTVLQTMRRRCDELRDEYGGPYSPERFPNFAKKKKAK